MWSVDGCRMGAQGMSMAIPAPPFLKAMVAVI